MTYDLLPALAGFAIVTSVTPGPNNLMLMASGVNFGLRRTLPHLAGITSGFVAMILILGAGLGDLLTRVPVLELGMKILSAAFIFWLAYKIATSKPPQARDETQRPMRFFEAAAFQWVNPKSWAMAVSAITTYRADASLTGLLLVAVIYGAINAPFCSLWAIAGTGLRRALQNPQTLRVFNIAMALLLLVSFLPVLLH
ncbi:LysE family translocator [Paracoccaceae bacterium GXU_MW_L88]